MKLLVKSILILFVALLLSGYPGAREDQVKQVEQSIVKVIANGADTHWIGPVDRSEAITLGKYIETYNDIAYDQDTSQEERCVRLKQAAVVAVEQRIKRFYGIYSVECLPGTAGHASTVKIEIYPQTDYGYRFNLTFMQTP